MYLYFLIPSAVIDVIAAFAVIKFAAISLKTPAAEESFWEISR